MFPKYIHAFSPFEIPACTQNICTLRRAKRGEKLMSAGASKTRPGCEEAFGVWVMLRSIPASTCPTLTLWDRRALLHSVLIVPFITSSCCTS